MQKMVKFAVVNMRFGIFAVLLANSKLGTFNIKISKSLVTTFDKPISGCALMCYSDNEASEEAFCDEEEGYRACYSSYDISKQSFKEGSEGLTMNIQMGR